MADMGSEYLVHNMMEEFVDCTVIEIGKLIFEYMQSRSARLVEGFNPAKGKGPILLRTTNELKRRLSRETDAAFIGRIMIFISLLLPPWERSGVNLRGNYNVESITKYEEPEEDENKMAIDVNEDSTGRPTIFGSTNVQMHSMSNFGLCKNISKTLSSYILKIS